MCTIRQVKGEELEPDCNHCKSLKTRKKSTRKNLRLDYHKYSGYVSKHVQYKICRRQINLNKFITNLPHTHMQVHRILTGHPKNGKETLNKVKHYRWLLHISRLFQRLFKVSLWILFISFLLDSPCGCFHFYYSFCQNMIFIIVHIDVKIEIRMWFLQKTS